MKKNNFRAVWQVCEKIIAYCALFIVVILECLSMFVPALASVGEEMTLGLIASSLLVIFSHVEDIKKECTQSAFGKVSAWFNDGLNDIFSKNKRIKSLDIMAHTTKTYIHSVFDNDVIIEQVRIMVCKPKESSTRHYPDGEALLSLDIARDQAIELWKDMQRCGRVKHLEIRYYEFDPTFYFAIINKQYVHYGIYKIEHSNPGYHLFNKFTLDGADNEIAHTQLNDYQEFFDHIYDNFSYEDSTCQITE